MANPLCSECIKGDHSNHKDGTMGMCNTIIGSEHRGVYCGCPDRSGKKP